MDSIISSSTALFETTTGFSFAELISWLGEMLTMILGMGLGLFQALLPWVMAIIVIGVIIGMVYRGLRWLHIIR